MSAIDKSLAEKMSDTKTRALEARCVLAEYIRIECPDRQRFGRQLKEQNIVPFDNVKEADWIACGRLPFVPVPRTKKK